MAQIELSFFASCICPKEPSPNFLVIMYSPMRRYSSIQKWSVAIDNFISLQLYQIFQYIFGMNTRRMPFYEVKDILSLKYIGDKQYCLVWWVNYPKQQATWEPIENMTFLKDWQQYYANLKKIYLKKQPPQEINIQHQPPKIELPKKQQQPLQKQIIDQFLTIKKKLKLTLSSDQINFTNFNNQPAVQKLQNQMKIKPQPKQNIQFKSQYLGKKQSIIQEKPDQSLQNDKKTIIKTNKKLRQQAQLNASDDEVQKPENKSRKIKKQRVRYGNLKGQVIQLRPISIDLQLKQPKPLDFMDKNISKIKRSFMKKGEMWYEVELEGVNANKNILLPNKHIKLLWPRKLAEYLLTKIKQPVQQ